MQYSLIAYRVAMGKHYHHLTTTDRVTLMFLKRQGLSPCAIASELDRSAHSLRLLRCKLVEGTNFHEVVVVMLQNKRFPQKIRGTLKAMFPHHVEFQVSHETEIRVGSDPTDKYQTTNSLPFCTTLLNSVKPPENALG